MKAINRTSEVSSYLAPMRRGFAVAALACAMLIAGTVAAENRNSQPEDQFSHYLARAVQIWSQEISSEAGMASADAGQYFGRGSMAAAFTRVARSRHNGAVRHSYQVLHQEDDHSSDDDSSEDRSSDDHSSDDKGSKDDSSSDDHSSDDKGSKDDSSSDDHSSDDKGSQDDDMSDDDQSSEDDVSKDRKSGCLPDLQVHFLNDLLHVSIVSDKKIKSVILLFEDGSTQVVRKPKGTQGVFAGQGDKAGLRLTGVWVRSGCNYKRSEQSTPCPLEEDDDSSSDDSSSDDGSSDDSSSDDGSSDDSSKVKRVKKCGEFFENEMATMELPVISIAGAMALEGSISASTLEFLVTLSEPVPAGQTVEVAFITLDGTAIAGEAAPFDYLPAAGILLFNEGEFMQIIRIRTIADDSPEVDETFEVVLSNPSDNARLGVDRATGTIVNDDDEDE